nr:hypothetical protein [uncultured Allomuricauda sp.]
MRIYHLIYYNLYRVSRKRNASPEIPVLSYMAFLMTSLLITGFNSVLLLLRLKMLYKIHYVGTFLVICLYGLNYYYFVVKGNGPEIMRTKKMHIGKKSIIIDISFVGIMFLSGFTYYLIREMNP